MNDLLSRCPKCNKFLYHCFGECLKEKYRTMKELEEFLSSKSGSFTN
jgi:phage FluMu protein Com